MRKRAIEAAWADVNRGPPTRTRSTTPAMRPRALRPHNRRESKHQPSVLFSAWRNAKGGMGMDMKIYMDMDMIDVSLGVYQPASRHLLDNRRRGD
eukprot:7376297-Prymnesium_polylepis.2